MWGEGAAVSPWLVGGQGGGGEALFGEINRLQSCLCSVAVLGAAGSLTGAHGWGKYMGFPAGFVPGSFAQLISVLKYLVFSKNQDFVFSCTPMKEQTWQALALWWQPTVGKTEGL